jgi:hypothetical protein
VNKAVLRSDADSLLTLSIICFWAVTNNEGVCTEEGLFESTLRSSSMHDDKRKTKDRDNNVK